MRGDYRPLLGLLKAVRVGTLFLELRTPRAGEMEVLRELPPDKRLGVGSVNQKLDQVEPPETILAHLRRAVNLFGRQRVWFTPDCGFATFADNPVAAAAVAEAKLRALVQARDRLV